MLAKLKVVLAAGFLAALLAGCEGPKAGPSGKDAGKVYDVTGRVVAVDAAKKTVTLDHEDIPGLMKAMKMEFAAEDEKVLAGISAGDSVRGKLRAEGGKYVVTGLEKR